LRAMAAPMKSPAPITATVALRAVTACFLLALGGIVSSFFTLGQSTDFLKKLGHA
jgi:hypothetical protein